MQFALIHPPLLSFDKLKVTPPFVTAGFSLRSQDGLTLV
jgi:hypothetical protein